MRLSFLFVALFFVAPCLSHAQTSSEDVIYLKNGGIIHGTILELTPDKSVKIQTKDNNVFVYGLSDVEKIVKETPKVQGQEEAPKGFETVTVIEQPTKSQAPVEPEFKQKGFHNITKFGPTSFNTFNATIINGYQFNPFLLLGLGVGLDTYNGMNNTESIVEPFTGMSNTDSHNSTDYFLPIYVDFRYHVSDKRVTFLTFLDLGYTVYLSGNEKSIRTSNSDYNYKPTTGGLFFCPGIGFKAFVTKNFGIVADFGMKFQSYGGDSYNSSYTGTGSITTIISDKYTGLAIGPNLNIGVTF